MPSPITEHLERALGAAEKDRLEEARDAVVAALPLLSGPADRVLAARILFAARDWALCVRVLADGGDDPACLLCLARCHAELGRRVEAHAALGRLDVAAAGSPPALHLALELHRFFGDPIPAALADAIARQGEPVDAVDTVEALLDADDPGPALALLDQIRPRCREPRHRRALGALFTRLGRFDEALGVLGDDDAPATLGLRAHALLWAAEWERAEQEARRGLESDPREPVAALVLAATQVHAGAHDEARTALTRLMDEQPENDEVATWLAEVEARTGRFREADAALWQACNRCPDSESHLAAGLLSNQIWLASGGLFGTPLVAERAHLWAIAESLLPPELSTGTPPTTEAARPAIRRMLDALGGNRSFRVTCRAATGHGFTCVALQRLWSFRHQIKRAQWRIRHLPPEAALEGLAEVAASAPASAHGHTYTGELNLWLGRYGEARRCFERALELGPRTIWAFYGQGMAHNLTGAPGKALAECALSFERCERKSPGLYITRGEAHFLLGQYEDARPDLVHSCRAHPTRAGAWVVLGLLAARTGDHDELHRVVTHLLGEAPGLLDEANRELALPLWRGPGGLDEGELEGLLVRCRDLLRGNRASSCAVFLGGDGLVHTVRGSDPPNAPWRARELGHLRSLLTGGRHPDGHGPSGAADPVRQPRWSLGPGQEAQVLALLSPFDFSTPIADGRLLSIQVRRDRALVVTQERDGTRGLVTLWHPDQAPARARSFGGLRMTVATPEGAGPALRELVQLLLGRADAALDWTLALDAPHPGALPEPS